MKTKKQIELTPTATARAAVPSLAVVTTVNPVLAFADESGAAATEDPNAIRPFHINIPESALADLRQRVLATRWPDRETVSDQSQGVQLAKLQALVSYCGTDYDWRKVEAKLNALPMFVTTIDGLDIQFIHVRSRDPNALPLIITHGWLPSDAEIALEWEAFIASLGRPAAQSRIGKLFERGFHTPGDVETRLGFHVGLLGVPNESVPLESAFQR